MYDYTKFSFGSVQFYKYTCDTFLNASSSRQVLWCLRERKESKFRCPSPAATMGYDPNLPACCNECAQLYTITYYQQSLEAFLLSHNDNDNPTSDSEKLETKVDRIPAPIFVKGPGAGSSKSFIRSPRHIPETKPLNISRNKLNDPSIITTSVPTRARRNPRKSSEREREPETGNEYNPLTSSLAAQDHRSPANRAHNRQNSRETGVTNYSASKSRRHNDDLPPIPTQDTNSSNDGRQLRYPQEPRGSYSVDKPQGNVGSLLIPSVRTDERNQSNYGAPSQIRPQTQQPRETRVSFSSNKPRDSDYVNPPPVPNQGRSQSNLSQIRPQTQQPRETGVSSSFSGNKPRDSDHVEPPSVPIQEKNQSYFSQTHSQYQETETSSNANKSRDRAERPKVSIPTQDQGQGRSSASDASNTDTRPHLLHGTPSQMDTQYVNMLLALDDIPTLHNLLAKFFNWILLAGFILFPGTFTSLQNLGGSGQIEEQLVHAITSIPL